MKYCIIITDGAADYPVDSLGNITPLEKAVKPNIDGVVSQGILGTVKTIPDGFPAGSDVAIMSLLGNDPARFYSGRAPIEAVAKGIHVTSQEWVFRCNLVTVRNGLMKDHSSDNISNEESKILMSALDKKLGSKDIKLYSGVSYRNLLVANRSFDVKTTPPHDILDKSEADYFPTGDGADCLKELILKSRDILTDHPINLKRQEMGLNPANSIWFWGQGRSPQFESFYTKFGIKGAIVAAVDLARGIGKLMGWDVLDVKGATGYLDTNYQGKGEKTIEALAKYDIVCVHIEAPDEAGHAGKPLEKIKAVEEIDKWIVKPVMHYLKTKQKEWRVMIMPDHATPCAIRTHIPDPILFTIAGSRITPDSLMVFTEKEALKSNLFVPNGYELINLLLEKT